MAPKTIVLKGEELFTRKEGTADVAITPGWLIEFGGSSYELVPHSTIGGQGRKAFAVENDLIGKGIDDDYAAGDMVQYGVCCPGVEIYAVTAETVALGDALESAGDGTLQVSSTPIEGSIIAWALEAGGPGRVKVEVA